MGLLGHTVTFGLGYAMGRPDGRRRLAQLRSRAVELSRRPEAEQLRHSSRNLLQVGLDAARKRSDRRALPEPGGAQWSRGWRRSTPAAGNARDADPTTVSSAGSADEAVIATAAGAASAAQNPAKRRPERPTPPVTEP
jgi:hypothetical protein